MKKNTVICLMGPTAAGKSDLAFQLAKQYPLDLISVDSVMVYRGMDIGTAKPTVSELQETPLALIDLCDPVEVYSAGQFVIDAKREIEKCFQNNRQPLLVGGTMMYFRALQQGLAELPKADESLRTELTEQAQQHGWEALHHRLTQIDPKAAKQIHERDAQRIQRALEVYELTGCTMSELQSATEKLPYDILNIVIAPAQRAVLHERIAKRFLQMLTQGLVAEVEALYRRDDLHADLPAIRAVGYRQVWAHLAGELDYTAMQETGVIATRQLAKRQLTWLRSWPETKWFDSDQPSLLSEVGLLLGLC